MSASFEAGKDANQPASPEGIERDASGQRVQAKVTDAREGITRCVNCNRPINDSDKYCGRRDCDEVATGIAFFVNK